MCVCDWVFTGCPCRVTMQPRHYLFVLLGVSGSSSSSSSSSEPGVTSAFSSCRQTGSAAGTPEPRTPAPSPPCSPRTTRSHAQSCSPGCCGRAPRRPAAPSGSGHSSPAEPSRCWSCPAGGNQVDGQRRFLQHTAGGLGQRGTPPPPPTVHRIQLGSRLHRWGIRPGLTQSDPKPLLLTRQRPRSLVKVLIRF